MITDISKSSKLPSKDKSMSILKERSYQTSEYSQES